MPRDETYLWRRGMPKPLKKRDQVSATKAQLALLKKWGVQFDGFSIPSLAAASEMIDYFSTHPELRRRTKVN